MMSKTLTGTFQITQWDEEPHIVFDEGGKQSYAQIKQTYSGHITGDSSIKYLMNYKTETSACFVGYEVMNVDIDGKKGRIILKHDGLFEQGVASSKFKIISKNSTGDLKSINGGGTFVSTENGQANYTFEIGYDKNSVKVIGI
ncbi:DUF3224 domain-containing protein [Thalassotalea psychrophila]|uniref:DUF3224 domain-containing protein n=1 Tax=Thalassotalea psychrophila TaxID=3065647 RepID=A0ABY9TPW2_9GAMM|nr:DUF3224 domain-containing protein [Colwelliaceae bacterium SQ149]